jgi:hypothetical protein
MYTAVQEHDLDLTMLDRRDFARSATSATTKAPARKWAGTISSRATNTRMTNTWCCRTKT